SDAQLPSITNGRTPKTNALNDNFNKKEFQALWQRINRKAVYRVDFESGELIPKRIAALGKDLRGIPMHYTVQRGIQQADLTDQQLQAGDGFTIEETATEDGDSVHSLVRYDLLGKIAEGAQLTRETTARILQGITPAVFQQFRQNPEQFISE